MRCNRVVNCAAECTYDTSQEEKPILPPSLAAILTKQPVMQDHRKRQNEEHTQSQRVWNVGHLFSTEHQDPKGQVDQYSSFATYETLA